MVAVPPRLNLARSCTALFRAIAISACVLMLPAAAQAQGLKFFKNYFYPGGHFAAGVSLKGTGSGGFATGNITIAPGDIPSGAEILAAFLYWQTVTNASGSGATGAKFRGHDISKVAKFLNPSGTPPCWSQGGATGGGSNAHQVKVYRADVMPFLPLAEPGAAQTKRTAVGSHEVRLPDVGTGNVVPSTAGATLLVIYRLAGADLVSTVIYDGGFTMNQGNPKLTQPLLGWYQALNGGSPASVTQIVANGQPNFTESIRLTAGSSELFLTTNKFNGPSWDTYTEGFTMPGGASSATLTVERGGTSGSFDCLSWGAVVLTTKVQDFDKDGIVDVLEQQSTSGTITDPNTGEKLPNLYAMGARDTIADLFIEFGLMRSSLGWTKANYQTVAAGHTHTPHIDALAMVARVLRTSPRKINVHFDLGGAVPNNISKKDWEDCPTAAIDKWTVQCAIIPTTDPVSGAVLADGGEFIEEVPCEIKGSVTSCEFKDYAPPLKCVVVPGVSTCEFSSFPGTVGWKSGFRAYRDEPLTHRKPELVISGKKFDNGPNEAACITAEESVKNGLAAPSTNCKRRFARNRNDWFHYVLWAHALGLPRSDGQPGPRNTSGIGDYLGADKMITLGLWDFATGTAFMQASTFLHEIGHNLGLRHGSIDDEPNCKPNYQSVMNYLFQVRGLITAAGLAEIGFSNQILKSLNEPLLSENAGLTTTSNPAEAMQWRTRWYTDWNDSFIDKALTITAVTKRCNGSPVDGEKMARVDGQNITGPIDWNANGSFDATIAPQDLNFSGGFSALAQGSNDWTRISLQEVGSRRNVNGWSADSGFWDTGFWDTGSDPGFWDTGFWDTGFWDTGFWDTGFWDTGFWDTGAENDPEALVGELDLDTAGSVGNAPGQVTAAPSGNNNVLVKWTPPNVGAEKVDFYEVFRVVLDSQTGPITQANFAARVPVGPSLGIVDAPTTQVLDTTSKNNVWYVYIVLAQLNDPDGPGVGNPPVRTGIATSAPFRR